MNQATFIKKNGLLLLAAAILSACSTAPPPKVVSDVMSQETAAKTVSANRKSRSNRPGAVLRDKTIQAVNELEMSEPDGKKFKFGSLQGKVILVDVWATWCGPCREQTPKLAALQEKYRAQGLAVVGLSLDETSEEAEVKKFMKEVGVNYTIAFAPDKVSSAFLDSTEDETGSAPIPQLFLIGKDGRLVEHLIGNDPRHSLAQLEELIVAQLK